MHDRRHGRWGALRRNGYICAALVLAALPAAAQTGALEVRVFTASDRAPLPGATVTLTSAQGLVGESAQLSDAEGRVLFPVLRGGTGYAIEVSFPGFATQRMSDLRVRSNETERLVISMLETQEEHVQVTAHSEVVDLAQVGASSRFSDEFIADLPVPGRFYQNVLTLAPGVNDADGDGNPNVHGARQRDFKAEIGGVSNVDPLTGQWLSFVHSETIEEMEILPSGAGVEFGRAQGGFARIIQTQGSNQFEGSLSYLYRSSRLDGAGASDTPVYFVPEFTWNQPSIQVSGPIVRDRLWFRLAHEWVRGEDPQNLISGVAVMPRDQKVAADQLTWQVSPRNKLAFQYQSSDLTLENYGISSTVPVESSYTLVRGGPTYSLSWLAPYSSNLLVDSLVSWQDNSFEITPTTSGVNQDCLRFRNYIYNPDTDMIIGYTALNRVRCTSAETGLTSGSFPETSFDERQRLTVRSNLTWFAKHFLGMSHRLKFGVSIEDERFHRELEREPDLNFRTQRELLIPCPTGGSNPCYGYAAYTTAFLSAPDTSSATAKGVTWGAYVEDQLKPAANVSLTLGLRLDQEEIDSEGLAPFDPAAEAKAYLSQYNPLLNPVALAASTFTAYAEIETFLDGLAQQLGIPVEYLPVSTSGQQGEFWFKQQRRENIALSNTNVSPRLAFSWDPWSAGKSKLALTAGRYYDKIFLAVPLVELEPPSTTLLWRTPPTIPFGAPPETAVQRYQAAGPQGSIAPTVRIQLVDRDLKTPYQDELALSFEREIWAETSISARFIRRWFRDQLQDVDINHATGDRGFCIAGNSLDDRVVEASPGLGAELTDARTGEIYVDTDPGVGDGRVDDCAGEVFRYVANPGDFPPVLGATVVPDGLDDLYVLNPGWGEVLLVGNFNSADYTAFVLELIRRQYRNWEMQASYTWSVAEGDAEDFSQDLGNERNLRADEQGYLDYDERHVLRFAATRSLPAGFRLGGTLRWQSGLPYSVLQSSETLFSIAPEYANVGDAAVKYRYRYPTSQRNDQRNEPYWNLDFMAAKDFAIGRAVQAGVSLEVFNVLEDDTVVLGDRVDGTNSGVQRFGRRWQVGARLAF